VQSPADVLEEGVVEELIGVAAHPFSYLVDAHTPNRVAHVAVAVDGDGFKDEVYEILNLVLVFFDLFAFVGEHINAVLGALGCCFLTFVLVLALTGVLGNAECKEHVDEACHDLKDG